VEYVEKLTDVRVGLEWIIRLLCPVQVVVTWFYPAHHTACFVVMSLVAIMIALSAIANDTRTKRIPIAAILETHLVPLWYAGFLWSHAVFLVHETSVFTAVNVIKTMD
jgi:hypothetical protein